MSDPTAPTSAPAQASTEAPNEAPTKAPTYTKHQLAAFADEVDINHPLTARRIPVLKHQHPRWNYHVAIIIGQPDWASTSAYAGQEPTDREVDQLCAYLDKTLSWYHDGYRARLAEQAPFDLDGTVNTFTFRKHAEYGWQYNARSWESGPPFVPAPGSKAKMPMTLEELLDHMDRGSRRWAAVKAKHPDIFDNVPTPSS